MREQMAVIIDGGKMVKSHSKQFVYSFYAKVLVTFKELTRLELLRNSSVDVEA